MNTSQQVSDEPFRHFGKEIIAVKQQLQPESPALDTLYLKLYKVLPLSLHSLPC